MGTPDNKLSELVDIVKSWIPRRSEPANLSRDFWMPDQSCRVCYECDSQFTIFNRRHHCRLCGRVFCAKCTANSIPASSDEPRTGGEDWERIRVCNYCFKQWKQGVKPVDNGTVVPSPGLSPSPSTTSLVSTKSNCTCNSSNSTVGSTPYATGPYQRVPYSSGIISHQSAKMDPALTEQGSLTSQKSTMPSGTGLESSLNQFGFCMNRSDDDDDDYGVYHSDSGIRHFCDGSDYYDDTNGNETDGVYGPHEGHVDGDDFESKISTCSPPPQNFDSQDVVRIEELEEEPDDHDNVDEFETSPYEVECTDAEPVDFENNGLLWLLPEPEDEEDEREAVLFDDDDDDDGVTGEWGYLRTPNSFRSGEYRSRDKSIEEHRKAMKNVVEGHFRALVAQLLQVENLPVGDEDGRESWLDIITFLSWEAATLLKPDTSKGGGMDPGGYVKVKCIACGNRNESMVVRGVVCKKNVAHRRMTSKIYKPRFLILGGALEYQRVSNSLSSFDTLLQQEMDHLKMAVAKIDAHHPNVLLVEKAVSRHAQEYLLSKDISLVLNIKRPLLERIARCTGAQIVPSIDHLTTPKLGYCDMFHVEKFVEEHGSAGQGGKKLMKTLMFFEDCPKPLGCTILLKGASGDELKKVKHVIKYGIFAAYHLALETSFLADEGASLPELPLKSPITVALPDKPSSIDRSISTIPGFTIPTAAAKPSGWGSIGEPQKSKKDLISEMLSSTGDGSVRLLEGQSTFNEALANGVSPDDVNVIPNESVFVTTATTTEPILHNCFIDTSEALGQGIGKNHADENALAADHVDRLALGSLEQETNNKIGEIGPLKEEFPPSPSPSDHQSILVSLSTRCVWKGTVCERAHLFRIKYYGSFDKPLGRFLRDHLFDQSYRCRSCEMPSEAHVHCYTHRQGSLTISVKKLPEFLLPGEREGKIWMWHRCLRCPRTNGFPPATRRVVMSDAAWGLSFGKFLELSFSNHAAASRVASCGHSLHRDCLRFYGFGKMVACFRYASIDVHSVYLPPSKLDFTYDNQEWIQKEANEVHQRAEILFTEVASTLHRISEKTMGAAGLPNSGTKAPEVRLHILDLEGILQKDREDFEESFQRTVNKEVQIGKSLIDILEVNKLRRQIIFNSYVWDQRLIHTASLLKNSLLEGSGNSSPKLKGTVKSAEGLADMNVTNKSNKSFSSFDSLLQESKPDLKLDQGRNVSDTSELALNDKDQSTYQDLNRGMETDFSVTCATHTNDKSNILETGTVVRRALSESESPSISNLSDTLDAAWTGESHPGSLTPRENGISLPDLTALDTTSVNAKTNILSWTLDHGGAEDTQFSSSVLPYKGFNNIKNLMRVGMPFPNAYTSLNPRSSLSAQKLGINEYSPSYVLSLKELEKQSGARLLLPVGRSDTVVPVYDDEPTSIIAYALISSDYHAQVSELEKPKDVTDSVPSSAFYDSHQTLSINSSDDASSDTFRSIGSTDENILLMSGSRGSQVSDPQLYTKDLHARVSFTDDGPPGKVKYTVTCYYAKRFEALRRICCPFELDFIRSLSRCKKWGAQGGKSNVFFAKTLDDRFIIKQVTKTELESFIQFGPAYFKYLSESISTKSPTCLAKILGIYQVSAKQLKGGKESKIDVLVMENLLFRRSITRLYDLKGSSRSRYNADTSGSNKVLLDQNLIEAMPTSPIFVGNKAKRLLERAVWNDTSFLASIDVMDYSLLVGVDEEKHELVLGIIDFMRQYTWDKHLETWVKTSGILGGPNTSPTVISPQQYKKRFRKAMTAYFLMVPDQWSPPTIIPSLSQSDINEENSQNGTSLD